MPPAARQILVAGPNPNTAYARSGALTKRSNAFASIGMYLDPAPAPGGLVERLLCTDSYSRRCFER